MALFLSNAHEPRKRRSPQPSMKTETECLPILFSPPLDFPKYFPLPFPNHLPNTPPVATNISRFYPIQYLAQTLFLGNTGFTWYITFISISIWRLARIMFLVDGHKPNGNFKTAQSHGCVAFSPFPFPFLYLTHLKNLPFFPIICAVSNFNPIMKPMKARIPKEKEPPALDEDGNWVFAHSISLLPPSPPKYLPLCE